MTNIRAVHGRQVFDSRGRPTVEVEVTLEDGTVARASVPSGASTGASEAHELRDGDDAQFNGLGVLSATNHVNREISAALAGHDVFDQGGCDAALRALDGTPNLARLGANAVLGTSLAVCRASAAVANQPLYLRIGELAGVGQPTLPMPMVNILSGGLHAGRGMDVQDFLAVPVSATNMFDALRLVGKVRDAATQVCAERGLPTLLADEGGLSPGCRTGREALELLVAAVEHAGLTPGADIAIAIDVAAASLYDANTGTYQLRREGRSASAEEMIEMISSWVDDFPVISVEDGLDEEDWKGWRALTDAVGGRVRLVGDDLFTTNLERVERGIAEGCANGVLVKVNQNGTLTGTLEVIAAARKASYAPVVSARSGETEDDLLADLAVGTAAGQIKVGSVRNSERLAKYNQLLRIAEDTSLEFSPIVLPDGSHAQGALGVTTAPAAVVAFLRGQGLLAEGVEPTLTTLDGGVSSDLWKVETPERTLCVKGALAQLKVAREWRAPVSRNHVEYEYLRFAAAVCPGQVPRVLAHDESAGLFAMEYLPPETHPVWKAELLGGRVGVETAAAVGDLVGRLHAASTTDTTSATGFATDANFDALRIEPFFRTTAAQHPSLADRLLELGVRTADTHLALVHGDVSPKNILLGPEGPVLLDAECAWFGDPAFDVAFCVNHLLLKSVRLPANAPGLLDAAGALAAAYSAHVSWEPAEDCAERVATLLPALALARIDGTSPVEYLDDEERGVVRAAADTMLREPVRTVAEAIAQWGRLASVQPAVN